ncbi:MAG: hypothetical protein LUG99_09355 [Lachnospiraceae bacterium]|nr:hypothetical protein [Lachnospiraceae bacterium]
MDIKSLFKGNKALYSFVMAFRALNNKDIQDRIWGINNNYNDIEIENYGDLNQGKIVYNLCIDHDCMGFFGLMRWLCTGLILSDRFGFVPHMSFSQETLYYDSTISYTNNPFEYYFQQNGLVDYNELLHSQNVVKFKNKHLSICDLYYKDRDSVDAYAAVWRKHIRLNPDIQNKIDKDESSLLDSKKTLGIHFRGTDYKLGYKNHPIPVTLDETINQIKIALDCSDCERIFVASDEQAAIARLNQEFPRLVCSYSDVLRSTDGKALHTSVNTRAHHQFLLGFEVLRDVITLSRCDGLIAGHSNVSAFADVIKTANGEKYDYFNIIDKGKNKSGQVFNKNTIVK